MERTLGRWMRLGMLCALWLPAANCRPAVDVANPSAFEEDDDRAGDSIDTEQLGVNAEPEPVKPIERRGGTVERRAVDEILDRGIGAFLAESGLDMHPSLDIRQRFRGWEIVRIARQGIDIYPGDVILSINDHNIERPSQVMRLWEHLRKADAIRVRGEREGEPFALSYRIVGAPQAQAP